MSRPTATWRPNGQPTGGRGIDKGEEVLGGFEGRLGGHGAGDDGKMGWTAGERLEHMDWRTRRAVWGVQGCGEAAGGLARGGVDWLGREPTRAQNIKTATSQTRRGTT